MEGTVGGAFAWSTCPSAWFSRLAAEPSGVGVDQGQGRHVRESIDACQVTKGRSRWSTATMKR